MKDLIFTYFPHIFWGFVGIIIIRYCYQFYKLKRIIDLDNKYKKFSEQGQLIEEGHVRPIWDYSSFPAFSRIWHKKEWQLAVAVLFLLILLATYLITDKQQILNLLGINFGIIIGTLIKIEK